MIDLLSPRQLLVFVLDKVSAVQLSLAVSALNRPLEVLVAVWMAMLLVVVLGAATVSFIM